MMYVGGVSNQPRVCKGNYNPYLSPLFHGMMWPLDFLTYLPTRVGTATLMVIVDGFSKMLILVPLLGDTLVDNVSKTFFS